MNSTSIDRDISEVGDDEREFSDLLPCHLTVEPFSVIPLRSVKSKRRLCRQKSRMAAWEVLEQTVSCFFFRHLGKPKRTSEFEKLRAELTHRLFAF